jgi:hypothetical protein
MCVLGRMCLLIMRPEIIYCSFDSFSFKQLFDSILKTGLAWVFKILILVYLVRPQRRRPKEDSFNTKKLIATSVVDNITKIRSHEIR